MEKKGKNEKVSIFVFHKQFIFTVFSVHSLINWKGNFS